MLSHRSSLALVSTLVLLACSDVPTPTQPSPQLRAAPQSAAFVASFNLPIQFPTGVADSGVSLYVSTGSLFRDTYVINRLTQTVVSTIPTGGNPRDVSFDGSDLLFSDLSNSVVKRNLAGTSLGSFALPFRGGGIATDGDTIWVGDFDTNQLLETANFGVSSAVFASDVRIEGMVFDSSSHTLWAVTPFPGDNHLYELMTNGALIRRCDSPYEPGIYGLGGITLVSDTFYISEPQGGDPLLGTTILIQDKASLVCNPALTMSVRIAIAGTHPGGRINPSHGVVRVILRGSTTLNVNKVDVASVRFGHSGTEAVVLRSHKADVDRDGHRDLVMWFRVPDTGVLCRDTALILTGKLVGGQAFKGSGAIRTVGCRR